MQDALKADDCLQKANSKLDVFAEVVVVEDAPVDALVDVPDLLVDHDVLDLLVDDLFDLDELALAHLLDEDDLVVVDLLDLDLNHVVHADAVDHLLLAELSLPQDDAVELLVVDLEDDLLLLIDALLVDDPALDESVLVLLVLDVL